MQRAAMKYMLTVFGVDSSSRFSVAVWTHTEVGVVTVGKRTWLVSCDLNFIVKGEGLFKVTGSHVVTYTGKVVISRKRC